MPVPLLVPPAGLPSVGGRLHPAAGKQIPLTGGRLSPRRLASYSPVGGGPVGWALRLPCAVAERATSPATTVAPLGRRLGTRLPVVRPPHELWGAIPLPSAGDALHGSNASVGGGLPSDRRRLGSAAPGSPLPGGRTGAPLRGGHAPAGDERPTGSVSAPAIWAAGPDRGRDSAPLGVRGALVRGTSPSGRCHSPFWPGEPGGAPRVGAQPVRGAQTNFPSPRQSLWGGTPGTCSLRGPWPTASSSFWPGTPYVRGAPLPSGELYSAYLAPCAACGTWPRRWSAYRASTPRWGTCPFSRETGAFPPSYNSGRPTWPCTKSRAATRCRCTAVGGASPTRPGLRDP